MRRRHLLLSIALASACALATVQFSLAKNSHHNNGHDLLGAKLNQDGKHEVGKIANNSVTAEVKGKKVVGMTAGNLTLRKVKSNKKMAGQPLEDVKLAVNGAQLTWLRSCRATFALALIPPKEPVRRIQERGG